jgi:LPXTG-motif cell wall-anchored protein
VVYDGEAHESATVTVGVPADAKITFFHGNTEYIDVPEFTDAGIYTISYTISKEGYNDVTGIYTFAIDPAAWEPDIELFEKAEYDGKAHPVADMSKLPEGAIFRFALTDENGNYEREDLFDIGEVPAFTEVGKYYLIYAAALDDNHEMVEGEFVFEIVEPAPETGDTFNLGLWLAVAALTAAAGIVLVLRRKEQA